MSINFKSLLTDLAKNAGLIVKSKLHSLSSRDIICRSIDDVTRRIDLEIENYVIEKIRDENVNSIVLTEERGMVRIGDYPKYIFIIDPLDGSLNFTLKIPYYTISIAVANYRENSTLSDIFAGIVYDISRDTIYYADDHEIINLEKLNVELEKPVISLYSNFDEKTLLKLSRLYKILESFKVRTLGSASLEMVMSVKNVFSAFLDVRSKLRIYDIAASYIIAKKCRTIVLNPNGQSLDHVKLFEKPRLNILMTNNEDIARKIIDVFREE